MDWLCEQISRSNFFFDIPKNLAQRGFRKSLSRKIWFSKNLDIKILRTKGLGSGTLGSPNRHGLDNHLAVQIVGARLDVTGWLWKTAASYQQEKPRPSKAWTGHRSGAETRLAERAAFGVLYDADLDLSVWCLIWNTGEECRA
jgi:hypothetical protein